MPKRLQIPEGEDRPLLKIVDWSDEVFDDFLDAILTQTSASSTGALVQGVVSQAGDDQKAEWEDVIGTITAMAKASLGIGRGPRFVSEDVAVELVEQGVLREDLASRLIERLAKILTSYPVQTAAQADMFLSLRGQLARRIKISTQLEPMYASDEDGCTPTGFLILQGLSIETVSTNDDHVAIFDCILDEDDIRLLRDAADQALTRRDRLSVMLKETTFQFKARKKKGKEAAENKSDD